MGTFHVFIKDLLSSGSSITIYCFCLQTAVWTQDRLARFSPTVRLWKATEDLRCAKCGRLGKVRDIDIHDSPVEEVEFGKPRVHAMVPLKGQAGFGKRQRRMHAD